MKNIRRGLQKPLFFIEKCQEKSHALAWWYEFDFDNLEKVIEWLENYFVLVTQYDLYTLVRSDNAQGCPQNLPSYIQMKKVYDSKS